MSEPSADAEHSESDLKVNDFHASREGALGGAGAGDSIGGHKDTARCSDPLPDELVPDSTWNDARVYGVISEDILDRVVSLSVGHNQEQKTGWDSVPCRVRDWLETALTRHVEQKQKNGRCFLQGKASDARRLDTMETLYILGVDIDNGMTFDAVCEAALDAGLFATVYSTYSSGATSTPILKKTLLDWIRKREGKGHQGHKPTGPEIIAYLREERGFEEWVLEHAKVTGERMNPGKGQSVFVSHPPIDKSRVVFVLRDPYLVNTRHLDPRDGQKEWTARIRKVCTKLALPYDKSCGEVARLFFRPSHKIGTTGHRIVILAGGMLDLESPEFAPDDAVSDVFAAAAQDMGAQKGGDRPAVETDADRVLMAHGNGFEFASLYVEYSERSRSGSNGYTEGLCPFDSDHSDAGNSNDYGFACKDGDGETGYSAVCQHATCKQNQGGDRFRFASKFCADHGITGEDLRQWCNLEVGEPWCLDKPATSISTHGFEECPADLDKAIDWANSRYTLARFGTSVVAFDLCDRPLLPMPRESLQAELAPQRVVLPAGEPGKPDIVKPLYPMWFNSPRRSYYRKTVFRPCADIANPVNLPSGAFNLFTGWDVPRVSLPRGSASYYPRFREHMYENMASGDVLPFVWAWCWWAQLFQHPEKKPGTAQVLRGRKGTGKSIIPLVFGRLMPDFVCPVSKPSDITGTFNMHLARALLVVIEEGFWAGSHEADSVFKDLITAPHFKAEPKGIDSQKMESYARFVVLGNEKWLVPATADERRFFALLMDEKRRTDGAYFKHIDEVEMVAGGDGQKALLDDLMETRAPAWVNLGKGLHTAELEQQMAHKLPLEDQWVRYCIEEGGFWLPSLDPRNFDPVRTDWSDSDTTFVTNRALFACYESFARGERHKNPVHFGRWLSDSKEGSGAIYGESCLHNEKTGDGPQWGRWIASHAKAKAALREQQVEAAQSDRVTFDTFGGRHEPQDATGREKMPDGFDPTPWIEWAIKAGKLPSG